MERVREIQECRAEVEGREAHILQHIRSISANIAEQKPRVREIQKDKIRRQRLVLQSRPLYLPWVSPYSTA